MGVLHKLQSASIFVWWKYSKYIDLINRNPLLHDFYLQSADAKEFKSRLLQYDYINRKFVNPEPISYLEFGVYAGESMKYWLAINDNPDSRFYGFDTFTGLPEDWSRHMKKGTFNLNGTIPEFDDNRAEVVKGMFQETLGPFLQNFRRNDKLVLHLDADLYSSTLFVLAQLDHLIKVGDIIIFDEFGDLNGEFKAYLDYKNAFKRNLKPVSRVLLGSWIIDKIAFIVE